MATYVNDLRLTELATGEGSGTWGTTTNLNLELIGEALGYGTQDCFATDADATTTVADGATDPARAMYFKVTSSATLTATRTLTIAPNTMTRVMLIENATTGSQSIAISQGSGGNVTIASGQVKMVYLDGAGAGAAVVDALADLELGTITVANLTATTADINGGTIDGATIGGASAAAGTFTTLQADTSLNVDGTVTADGLTVDASSAELQKNTGSTFIIGTKDAAGSIASPIYTDIKFEGFNNRTNALLRSWDESSSTAYGRLEIQTNDGSSAKRRALFDYNGDISFYEDTGTTPKFFWDASAEALGIGASPSTHTLEVWRSGGDHLLLGRSGVGTYELGVSTDNALTFEDGGTERIRIDSSGDIRLTGAAPNAEDAISAINFFNSSSSQNLASIIGKRTAGGTNYGSLIFNTTNGGTAAERMRITSAGNVGIGTDSPASLVSGGSSPVLSIGGTDGGLITGEKAGALSFITSDGSYTGTYSDGITGEIVSVAESSTGAAYGLAFYTGTTTSSNRGERVRISNSGNVGIGTSSPTHKLEIRNDVSASTDLDPTAIKLYNNSDGGSAIEFSNGVSGKSKISFGVEGTGGFTDETYIGFSTTVNGGALSEAMRIDSAQNLLVGGTATNPAGSGTDGIALSSGGRINGQVSGDWHRLGRGEDGTIVGFYSAGGIEGSISISGSITLYNTSSDYRLKDVDGPITNSGAYIDALKPVQGSWKVDGSRFIGLIAHEVQEVSETQIATGEKDGEEMQGMSYSAPELIANLIAEIQSLRARVAQLEGA